MNILIETARLRLRTWRDEDAVALAAMNADPQVMRFFPETLDRQASDAALIRMRDEWCSEGFGIWAVELKESGQWIGFTGLHRVGMPGPLHGNVEVAWRFRSDMWGNGYAPEAALAALEFARCMGISELVSFTAQVNHPSQRVMQKIGMEYRGSFTHPALAVDDPLCLHVLYDIVL